MGQQPPPKKKHEREREKDRDIEREEDGWVDKYMQKLMDRWTYGWGMDEWQYQYNEGTGKNKALNITFGARTSSKI